MAVGDSADATVTKIAPGYGRSRSYITVKFAGDGGRVTEKEFACDNDKVGRLSLGDTVRVEHIHFAGWQIDPSEHLASGFS
jgi:hypothetical protein